MKTYYRKMKVFSIGRVSSNAVRRRRAKKYAGLITRHFDPLSILRRRVLKLFLASFSLSTANRRKMMEIRNTGITIETTKRTYESSTANFLIEVELSPSMIFMTEKKVKSKYTSM